MSSPDKNKVLFLTRWYPNRYDPMPGLFIERHARSVSEHYDMAVLYIHQDEELNSAAFEVEKFRDEELFQVKLYYRPVHIRIPSVGRFINLLLYIFYSFKGLLLLEKEWGQPDLIHVNVLTRVGAIALIHKWLTRVPYVITEHWTRYLPHMDNFRGRIRKAVTRLVVKEASAVLPV
ncbi:MAG: glycosyltransferase, partial [Bacteroidales bacterium]|nr:glycosyltransferase [Bacteroidales bacterium]